MILNIWLITCPSDGITTYDAYLIRLVTYRWWLTIATLTFPKTETKPWLHNLLTCRAIFLNYQKNGKFLLLFLLPGQVYYLA